MSPIAEPLLVILLGSTGSGKTALAVALGEWFGGEIVSCDSVAVYRGLQIGAAKPSASERARVPHHLLDIADPNEAMTAGDWGRHARGAVREIAARGRLPIVSGGTGLYLRALTEGLAPLPPRCPALRERLQTSAKTRPPGYLHRLLRRLDAPAAKAIHPHDQPKLIRALEVALLGPAPISGGGRDPLTGFRQLRIGLAPDRPALYERLNRRAEAMFREGLLEETRALRKRWGARAAALGSLGYREAGGVLDGTATLENAIAAVQQGHRNYSKRQGTWFRREPGVHWLTGFGDEPEVEAAAVRLVSAALAVPSQAVPHRSAI